MKRYSLLRWYDAHKRDLPWRRTSDPYHVWVSEIMLQQTTVATCVPFFERFIARFPTVAELAAADEQDVLAAWSGLGYYARARNLHRAARAVASDHSGALPPTAAALRALPGVGRYTAGAVASIAFGEATPLVDANVARVLCRLFAVRGDPKTAAVARRLWELAAELVPAERPGDWNQALMELGARVCTPADPRCGACPLAERCCARRRGLAHRLPEIAKKAAMAEREDVCAVVAHPDGGGRLLLVRRPPEGVWASMHELPRVERRAGEELADAAVRAVAASAGLVARAVQPLARLGPIRHTVMRTRITLHGVLCATARRRLPRGADGFVPAWHDEASAAGLPMASPQRRLLRLAAEPQLEPFDR